MMEDREIDRERSGEEIYRSSEGDGRRGGGEGKGDGGT